MVVRFEDVRVIRLHMEPPVRVADPCQSHAVHGSGDLTGRLQHRDLFTAVGAEQIPAQATGLNRLYGRGQVVIQGHAVQNALPAFLAAQQLLDGKRQLLALDALPVPLFKGHKKCGGVGVRVVAGQLAVARAVKGRVEPIAVEKVHRFIEARSCQVLQ